MAKKINFKEFKKKALQDEQFAAEYEKLRPEFELVREFIKARKDSRCSQQELAEKLKLQQPAVARMEKGGYTSTSIANLIKIADALGYELKLHLEPKKRK